MDLAVGGDQVERLRLGLENGVGIAAQDNDNVKVLEALVGLLEGDLGANDDTSIREDLGLSSSDGDIEGLGGYRGRKGQKSQVSKQSSFSRLEGTSSGSGSCGQALLPELLGS